MKLLKSVLLSVFAVSIMLVNGCSTLVGPKEKDEPADISLNVLESKMRKAMDPNGLYRKSTSYVQKQMLQEKKGWDQKEFIVEVRYKRPDMFKTTTIEENRPSTSIILNKNRAWFVDFKKKKIYPVTGERLAKLKVMFGMGRPDSSYQNLFKQVKLSQCVLEDKEYYKLTCISGIKDMAPFKIYVGKNNFLTKRLETIEKIGGNPEDYISTIDKYSLYEGVMIPADITVMLNKTMQKFRIILYKLNVPIKNTEFLPPVFEEETEE
jgi:outer membrane lipoprotein-sorting protein